MTKEADGTLTITLENGEVLGGFDQVLVAAGREPILDTLGLDSAGVKIDRGYITVRNSNLPRELFCLSYVKRAIPCRCSIQTFLVFWKGC